MCRILVVELYWICWLLLKSDAKEKSSIVYFHSSLFYEDNSQKLHFFASDLTSIYPLSDAKCFCNNYVGKWPYNCTFLSNARITQKDPII